MQLYPQNPLLTQGQSILIPCISESLSQGVQSLTI